MNLGNTIEEKRANFALLDAKAKKWGKVGRIVGWICAIFISLGMLTAITNGILEFIGILITCAVMIIVLPIFYYYYAQILCYGYIKVREWFAKKGIGAEDVALAAGGSIAISYFLGGRKSAKIAGVMWLVLLFIVISVGVFVGLYYYYLTHKEMKEIGVA